MAHAWDNRYEPETAGIDPFTDDLNRVDILSERINVLARKNLHEYYKKIGNPAW